MSEIKIDIQRTGFPVKIGKLELWFDSSFENLRRFFDIDKIAKEKLKEAEKKAMHIHFPDNFREYKPEDYTEKDIKNVDAALDLNKEFIAAQYDILFGDGTFKKIYKEYPDIIALEKALDPIGHAIAEKIKELEKERAESVEELKKEALQKQKAKQKK
jgi:hypothetical protein